VAASVIWEDCDRPTHEVYFETGEQFADSLTLNPHAFLIACAIPALHYGERRISIDAPICPELRLGLTTALSVLHHWYYPPQHEVVQIEAQSLATIRTPRTPERAGFFFSGGIDSYSLLRANQLFFPPDHPGSIKDGLVVYGLELDIPQAFEYVLNTLSKAAPKAGINLIPVYTNLYLNYRAEDAEKGFAFWLFEFGGAALAAVAHALARRFTVVSTASTHNVQNIRNWGSHPLLDPNYSSIDLRVRYGSVAPSRLEKTALIADWDVALQHLRVCNRYKLYQRDRLNCGQCEKCIRTMLALLALGVLDRTCAFPAQDLSEELVRSKGKIKSDYMAAGYREVITPLEDRGRHDLVRGIKYALARYYDREPGLKGVVKRLDRRYLDGNLRRFIRSMKR
jgi:hypothetical protein